MLRSRTTIILTVISVVALLFVGTEDVLAQCSLCKRALEASGRENLINGFKWSIIFMVIPPTLMTAGIGALVLKSGRSRPAKPIDDATESEDQQSA